MIAAEKLGVDPDDVDVLHSDTAIARSGSTPTDRARCRSAAWPSPMACDKVIDKAKQIAAHQLEAPDDLEFAGGVFRSRDRPTGRCRSPRSRSRRSPPTTCPTARAQPRAQVTYDPPNFSWPFGTHMCAVEVDTETGEVEVLKYVAVDDCGVQVNPLIVDGQVHGGVVQGSPRRCTRRPSTTPTATSRPRRSPSTSCRRRATCRPITLGHTVTPSPTNQLGVKGIGEAGTIGAAPAVINAIVDALSGLGVRDIDMPAARTTSGTPSRRPRQHHQQQQPWRLAVIPAAFDYVRAGSAEEAIASSASTATRPSSSPAATASCRS
jgi:aerobic carbon-monoxide dehydrogenase large subunit